MALQKVNRNLLNTGVSDSSDATAITIDSGEAVTFASTVTSTGKITADAGIDIDNINIDGTTISQSGSSDLTIDVGGDIILDADTGVWRFKDAGTTLFQIAKDGQSLVLYTGTSDGDMLFKGNDGGSTVTALTLDMSEAGAATFNGTINGSKRVTLTNTSSEHLRLAYNNSYYWDITRENVAGDLTFDSSNVSGVSLTLGAANKKLTTAGGILFGTDTADDNTLDDYEEGSWTPRITSSSGTAFTSPSATYTKIGRLVTIRFDITNNTGTGTSLVYGLPFTSSGHGSVHITWNNQGDRNHIGGYTNTGSIQLIESGSTTSWSLGNGERILGFGLYFTD